VFARAGYDPIFIDNNHNGAEMDIRHTESPINVSAQVRPNDIQETDDDNSAEEANTDSQGNKDTDESTANKAKMKHEESGQAVEIENDVVLGGTVSRYIFWMFITQIQAHPVCDDLYCRKCCPPKNFVISL
jgi:hypothetical protein